MLTSNFNVRRLKEQKKQVDRLKKVRTAANWDEILLKREDEASRNDAEAS